MTYRTVRAAALALMLAGCGTDSTGLGIDLVSNSQVQQMGLEAWKQLRAETPASRNAEYQRTAQRVSERLLRAAGKDPRQWEVVVFAGDQVNAFALPGGKIGVYEGMFRAAQNEDQLAAVIGHEIAHNEAEHASERLSSQVATDLAAQLAGAVLGGGQATAALLGAGAQYGLVLPYSRNQELEADRLGLRYMARAGYDPRAAVALWQRMQSGSSRSPSFLSTHPAPEERIRALQAALPEVMRGS